MKIIVPTVRRAAVGTRYNFGTDIVYDCPNRDNVYTSMVETPVFERRLTALTVFDRDLRVADRLVGVCQLALLATGICVMIPMAALFFTLEAATKVVDYLGDRVGDLMRSSGIPRYATFTGTFAALFRKVFA
jgi:hypothetical protein